MQTRPEVLAASIDAFAFDSPEDADPFGKRLARENGWREEYAAQVIGEYRRFLVLAVVAGHPVAPSDEVDQAWHLHLLDSTNYRRFCDEVLGRPLEHLPSRGGPVERQRLISDYRQTLRSYRKRFAEAPPAAVWPEAEERFNPGAGARRVELQKYWLVPKPAIRPSILAFIAAARSGAVFGLLLAVLALVLAGCALDGRASGSLTGPEFIGLQLGVWFVSVLIAWLLRNHQSAAADVELPELHPYEVAHLSGGPTLALDSALTALIARGELACDHTTATLRVTPKPLMWEHPLERAVHDCIAQRDGLDLPKIRGRARELTLPLGERLEALGLTGAGSRLPFWIAMTAPVVGGLRILSRLGSDRPIGGLLVLCFLGVCVAWLAFAPGSARTATGDAVLARLRQDHEPLRELPFTADGVATGPLTLSIALFGLGILAHTALSDWSALVATKASASNSGGYGGGWTGGGCTGGGGCGGGCGGCGGCGGE